MKKRKKIAVVCSGWHYPEQFYRAIASQRLPKDWDMDLFCVSHRDPKFAIEEKAGKTFGDSLRGKLDKRLYERIVTREGIESLGWTYIEKPNTVGDWGNSNQWLEDYDYKKYDLLLFTHDDNLILNPEWFKDVIEDGSFKDFDILANSVGMPAGWLRGSCEFFKPSVIEKMGGRFDLSEVTLTREGETSATEDLMELNDWNSTVHPLMRFIEENGIKVGFMSPSYRVSAYCIEGERGYISNTHGQNTEHEDKGLNFLKEHRII